MRSRGSVHQHTGSSVRSGRSRGKATGVTLIRSFSGTLARSMVTNRRHQVRPNGREDEADWLEQAANG